MFVKKKNDNLVINSDSIGYEQYKMQRNHFKQMKEVIKRIEALEEEIKVLKNAESLSSCKCQCGR
jgi:hypothetical protein